MQPVRAIRAIVQLDNEVSSSDIDTKLTESLPLATQKVSNEEDLMISQYTFGRIRDLSHSGKNKTEISRELGINRKTVRKYCESTPHRSTRRGPKELAQIPLMDIWIG